MRKISTPMRRALERLGSGEKLIYTNAPRPAVGFMMLPRIHLGTYKALVRRGWIVERYDFEGSHRGVSVISVWGQRQLVNSKA